MECESDCSYSQHRKSRDLRFRTRVRLESTAVVAAPVLRFRWSSSDLGQEVSLTVPNISEGDKEAHSGLSRRLKSPKGALATRGCRMARCACHQLDVDLIRMVCLTYSKMHAILRFRCSMGAALPSRHHRAAFGLRTQSAADSVRKHIACDSPEDSTG